MRRPFWKGRTGNEQLDAFGRIECLDCCRAAGEGLGVVARGLKHLDGRLEELEIIMHKNDACRHRVSPSSGHNLCFVTQSLKGERNMSHSDLSSSRAQGC